MAVISLCVLGKKKCGLDGLFLQRNVLAEQGTVVISSLLVLDVLILPVAINFAEMLLYTVLVI